MSLEALLIPESIVKRLREEARRIGLGFDEYIIDLLSRNLDPDDRSIRYAEASRELLDQARKELNKKNIRQASEKLWGSVALAVKAYALWKDKETLTSYSDLWRYSGKIIDELGDWVSDAWTHGNAMHTCFYEGWCSERHVEEALKRIERFVNKVVSLVKNSRS